VLNNTQRHNWPTEPIVGVEHRTITQYHKNQAEYRNLEAPCASSGPVSTDEKEQEQRQRERADQHSSGGGVACSVGRITRPSIVSP